MSLTLARAVRAEESKRIAFVGSGGKTTAIFQLARQLAPPVIVTATSHLGTWQLSLADKHIVGASTNVLEYHEKKLPNIVLITGEVDGDRTKPVNDDVLDSIHKFCLDRVALLLIEADGSRQKPLKGWAGHEPPIPAFADHIVQVAGLSGLGKSLSDEFVHRPEEFSKLSGLKPGEEISIRAITRVLLHSKGARKNFPHGARRTIILNQADTPELQANARGMARSLLAGFDSAIISDLTQKRIHAAHERVAGIILAAGDSTRFGSPKQLLDWHGEPFTRVVARKALEAGLSPIFLVVGAHAEDVGKTVDDLNVKVIENTKWRDGQSTSIKTGVSSVLAEKSKIGAAIFLLIDQPHVRTSILQALVERHAEKLPAVVAPMVMDRRANPVLFDRRTFSDLLTLEGDVGGRAIFHKHSVEYVPWHDDRLLLDVDTPEHYQRLLADETL